MRQITRIINYSSLGILLAACASESATSADGTSGMTPTAREFEQARAANDSSRRMLESIISEVQPHIRYEPDGRWSVDAAVDLSPRAASFVREAQRVSAPYLVGTTESSASRTNAALSVAANQQGISFAWWGARIAVPSGAVTGIASAWRTAGGPAAVKLFLSYFGYSGWAVSVAGVLVPAYAITIEVIDRMGGRRGVYMYVPWSIVPTFIAPQ